MSFSLLWEGFLIGIAVSVPLGPLGMLCIKRTVNKNWKSGFVSGLGIAASDVIYAIVAGFSLTIIINFISTYEIYFKILGASMVVLLGLYIFMSNPAKDIQKFQRKGISYLQDFLTAFLLTVTNPLSVFVFIAIFTSYSLVLQLSQLFEALLIIGGIFVGGATWWFILTGLAHLFRHKLTINTLWWANKIIGLSVILIAVGLFIFLVFEEI
ncbi:MAG TPA: LysE family transporter [Prolixibacteraceae bacterium]|nr:LysE family transporter [Prolixibacteraceae bacterium]